MCMYYDEEIIKLRESGNPLLKKIADDFERDAKENDVENNIEEDVYEKVLEQLEWEKDFAYADFERYAEEKGLDKEQDFFSEGMKRAIEVLKRVENNKEMNKFNKAIEILTCYKNRWKKQYKYTYDRLCDKTLSDVEKVTYAKEMAEAYENYLTLEHLLKDILESTGV